LDAALFGGRADLQASKLGGAEGLEAGRGDRERRLMVGPIR
jgi:hypothetical protein